ncbi:hypothetical protein [Domibacillus robiginosus]|uniref:hypothetical protein n=1 Tax=Domibacillus robiginosus TaxID=1071054 RepID=UPI00067DB4D1|nr:hypothetical protein [Domibacillus robiginosus]
MTTKLQRFFSKVQSGTEQFLSQTAPFDHPLLTLIRTSLQEQKETLDQLLPELSEEKEAELPTVKEFISIVYHNHEIALPLFEAWKRANDWMNLPSKATAEKLEPLFPEMKKALEEAAMELEHIYGKEDIKFVVPSFYIPTIR